MHYLLTFYVLTHQRTEALKRAVEALLKSSEDNFR